ncbi:hypothetical protein IWQ61_007041 [Dispira simplex]|nr:hypothetical protein IWQ61_007041 [Dispira simplex]
MASFPHILEITSTVLGNFYVVHAGLDANLSLEEQDPSFVYSVEGTDTSETDEGSTQHWFTAWNALQEQRRLNSNTYQPYTVIYGYDAELGLQNHSYTIGLDMGCVKQVYHLSWEDGYDPSGGGPQSR